jgi:hypothetical protein
LKYIAKESGKAMSERSNEYDLPAPIFAAAVHARVDIIYELFRADVGVFEHFHSNEWCMDVND